MDKSPRLVMEVGKRLLSLFPFLKFHKNPKNLGGSFEMKERVMNLLLEADLTGKVPKYLADDDLAEIAALSESPEHSRLALRVLEESLERVMLKKPWSEKYCMMLLEDGYRSFDWDLFLTAVKNIRKTSAKKYLQLYEVVPLRQYWNSDYLIFAISSGKDFIELDPNNPEDRAWMLSKDSDYASSLVIDTLLKRGIEITDPKILSSSEPARTYSSNESIAAAYIEYFKKLLPKDVPVQAYLFSNASALRQIVSKKVPLNGEDFKRVSEAVELLSKIDIEATLRVALDFAKLGIKITDRFDLLTKPYSGTTVAHCLAEQGVVFEDMEILASKDRKGNTVAHVLAKRGYDKFPDPVVWSWKNNRGWSVWGVCRGAKFRAMRAVFS